MALRGYRALIKEQSSAVAMTNEATTMSGGNTIYTITNTARRLIDLDTPVIVNVGGSPVTTGFVIDRLNGRVIFGTSATRTVTITGAYVTTTTVVEAKQFAFNGTRDALDATRFQQQYREFEVGHLSGTASLTLNYLVNSTFYALLVSGSRKIIEYYPNDDVAPIRFFGLMTSNGITAPVDGIIDETIEFTISTQIA